METHLKEAQLKYLQAQINPHFLFNSLNAGAQLAMMGDADNTGIFLEKMADFFRYNVRKMEEDAIDVYKRQQQGNEPISDHHHLPGCWPSGRYLAGLLDRLQTYSSIHHNACWYVHLPWIWTSDSGQQNCFYPEQRFPESIYFLY